MKLRVSNSIERNISYWTEQNANGYADAGRRHWLSDRFTWGEYDVPESDIGALPDVAGKDVIEHRLRDRLHLGVAWLVVGLNRSSASTRRRRSWRRPMSSDGRSARVSLSYGPRLQKPCRRARDASFEPRGV